MYRDFSYIHCPHVCIASSIINTIHQNSICIYQEWSTLTHDNHSMSTVSLRIPYWCCIFCGFGQMCIYPYIHHLKYVKYSHYSKNPLFSACSSLPWLTPLLLPLATADIFVVSTDLPFPQYHIVGIRLYAAFSDWLLSLNNMCFSFLSVFQQLDSSFLFSTE